LAEPKKNTIKLRIAKSLDGNLIIHDHPKILFVMAPSKRKLTLIAKENVKDDLHPTQKRFVSFAMENGFIIPGSESNGYLPNMFELTYPEDPKKDTIKIILKFIHQFILKDKEIYDRINKHKDSIQDRLINPDEEHSTELGEVGHSATKGSSKYMPYVNAWFGWGYPI
jgi:hypothetical protein